MIIAATLPPHIWLDLWGKPFREGGRGPDSFDCVGLLLEIYRRLGIELPPWNSSASELPGARLSWHRVTDPQPGDGILIRSNDPDWHIGIVYGQGSMIHAHTGCGVVIERYSAHPWHKRIEGIYRWKPELSPQPFQL